MENVEQLIGLAPGEVVGLLGDRVRSLLAGLVRAELFKAFQGARHLHVDVNDPDRVRLDIETFSAEASEAIADIGGHLKAKIDGPSMSPSSKVPFKVALFRETLAFRIVELGRAGIYHLSREQELVAGILMARAAVETAASCWHLKEQVSKALSVQSLDRLGQETNRLLLGTRVDVEALKEANIKAAVNVLTLVDAVNVEFPGLRYNYDQLSEFCHPNWSGTTGAYSTFDEKSGIATLGFHLRLSDFTKRNALASLTDALQIFRFASSEIDSRMPDLLKLSSAQT